MAKSLVDQLLEADPSPEPKGRSGRRWEATTTVALQHTATAIPFFCKALRKVGGDETAFNRLVYGWVKSGAMSEEVFVELLAMTQGSLEDSLDAL